MVAFNFFDAFTEHTAEKVHNLGSDTLTVALCSAANAPSASADAVLADVTQISYTNLSSRVLTTSSSAQTAGDYALTLGDLTLTASGGSVAAFRYILIYNDTPTSPADPLIGWYDYGSDLTLATGESLLIDFSGALITIG
jgi:hypothetical protein